MDPSLTNVYIDRALEFIDRVESQGENPTADQIDAFSAMPLPDPQGSYYAMFGHSLAAGYFVAERGVTHYLKTVGLVAATGSGLGLTPTGKAFSRSLQESKHAKSSRDFELIEAGSLEDPYFYAHVLTQINKIEDALLVDPYLPSALVANILQLGNVRRILTKKGKIGEPVFRESEDERDKRLQIAMGAATNSELRYADSGDLHDRLVLSPSGDGLLLGTSLGGAKLTIATKLNSSTNRIFVEHYDAIWRKAKAVEPVRRK